MAPLKDLTDHDRLIRIDVRTEAMGTAVEHITGKLRGFESDMQGMQLRQAGLAERLDGLADEFKRLRSDTLSPTEVERVRADWRATEGVDLEARRIQEGRAIARPIMYATLLLAFLSAPTLLHEILLPLLRIAGLAH